MFLIFARETGAQPVRIDPLKVDRCLPSHPCLGCRRGGRSVTSQRTAVKRTTKWKDDVFIRLYLSSNRANPQLIV